MHGGMYPFDDRKNGRKQKAVVEFICAPERTGLEGEDGAGEEEEKEKEEDGEENKRRKTRRDDEDDGEGKEKEDDGRSLRFISYGRAEDDDDIDVLRLEWLTKHACDGGAADDGGSEETKSRHWGFFTWFIIVSVILLPTFLSTSSPLN